MSDRPAINLRFWEGEGELSKLASVGEQWWDKVETWLNWLGGQSDMETAPLEIVNLIAWQRDITRLSNESEEMYRKRVKYALANAKDSSTKAGFTRIWQRLGLGTLEQRERIEGEDWDVIGLTIDEETIGEYQGILETIIRQYGRTCRRYTLETQTEILLTVGVYDFSVDSEAINAEYSLYSEGLLRINTNCISVAAENIEAQ